MQPADIADSYDSIAHLWLEPHLATNGIRQHEHALKFRTKGERALDIGCGCNGRFLRLLESYGYEVEGLDVSARMIALANDSTATQPSGADAHGQWSASSSITGSQPICVSIRRCIAGEIARSCVQTM